LPRQWLRKGVPHIPQLPVLFRDAQPTYADIEGEPDAYKRAERERARDRAIDELVKRYRAAEKGGKLNELDPGIRWFCEALKRRNDGRFPKARGGAPTKEHERLLLAISVQEKIEALGKTRGKVELALREVADQFRRSYDHVRDIHYDRDPHWRSILRAEVARRKYETAVDAEAARKTAKVRRKHSDEIP
jgi:hypothetical protein